MRMEFAILFLILALVTSISAQTKTKEIRDIYLTPPAPTGCGLIRIANGTGST